MAHGEQALMLLFILINIAVSAQHARMSPPPKPSPEMAIGAMGVLRELRDEGFTEPIGVHMALAEHFLGQDSNLSKRLGHHILHQAGYVKEGLLHDIQ